MNTHELYLWAASSNTWTRVDIPARGGLNECISTGTLGISGAISSDKRYVAISTCAPLDPSDAGTDNDIYLRDLAAGTTDRITPPGCQNGGEGGVDISEDGNTIAYDRCVASRTDNECNGSNVFLRDRDSGATRRITTRPAASCWT